jgi:hypothetical protein
MGQSGWWGDLVFALHSLPQAVALLTLPLLSEQSLAMVIKGGEHHENISHTAD